MVTACHERSLMAASNSGRIAERNPCSRLLPASGENAALIATFTSVPMARFNQSFFPKRSMDSERYAIPFSKGLGLLKLEPMRRGDLLWQLTKLSYHEILFLAGELCIL